MPEEAKEKKKKRFPRTQGLVQNNIMLDKK
jgi:hypothetical protein